MVQNNHCTYHNTVNFTYFLPKKSSGYDSCIVYSVLVCIPMLMYTQLRVHQECMYLNSLKDLNNKICIFTSLHISLITEVGVHCSWSGVQILHITIRTGMVHIVHLPYFTHFTVCNNDSCTAGGCWSETGVLYTTRSQLADFTRRHSPPRIDPSSGGLSTILHRKISQKWIKYDRKPSRQQLLPHAKKVKDVGRNMKSKT